jgi:hypothetical protein
MAYSGVELTDPPLELTTDRPTERTTNRCTDRINDRPTELATDRPKLSYEGSFSCVFLG